MNMCAGCNKKPIDIQYKPFCSKRCADVDLHRWASGSYVIAGTDTVNITDEMAETDDTY